MNYKKLIIFYKGIVLRNIHNELNKYDNFSICEIDNLLKHISQIDKSCTDMNYEEISELIIWSFIFGDKIGIYINFKDNEWE
jgi:hypothetical protein